MIESSILYEWLRWIRGGPRDFWVTNLETIANFIARNEIPAMEKEHLIMDDPIPLSPESAAETSRLKRPSFPGGLKCPHLHSKGDIYLLTEEQWNEFKKEIVPEFEKKLRNAKSVNYTELMQLSEVISGIH
jgi:hypothetical protein